MKFFSQTHASPEVTYKNFLENVLSSFIEPWKRVYEDITTREDAVRAIMHVTSCPICSRATQLDVYDEYVIRYMKLDEGAKLPKKAYDTDAAYDVYALHTVDLIPGVMTDVHTGIALEMPRPLYATFEGRSSMHIRNIHTTRGIIDNEYRGEVSPYMLNNSEEIYTIKQWERCAQLVFHYGLPTRLVVSSELTPTLRGKGGTGSTGKY